MTRLPQAGRTVQALETVYTKATAFLVCAVKVTDKVKKKSNRKNNNN